MMDQKNSESKKQKQLFISHYALETYLNTYLFQDKYQMWK